MEYLALLLCALAAAGLVLRFVDAERAERLERARLAVAWRAASHPPPVVYPQHYSPQYHLSGAAAIPPAPVPPPTLPAPALPGVTTLGQVLDTGWRPTQAGILLALGPGGAPLTAGVGDDLCHIILCGATGAGKTNTLRLLLVQLLAVGAQVYLLNPKHTDRHWRTGEEWIALAAATTPGRAITDVPEIGRILRWAREVELPARQARFQRGESPGPPLFLVVDEWPQIVGADPALADTLADLVRLGREYLIELLLASQDVLTDTLGTTTGPRAQFQTRYYGGGDATSKRVLMTPQPKGGLPEPPGRGVVYLWAVPTGRQPALVRVPLVDNADIGRLLGAPSRPSAPHETGETAGNGGNGTAVPGHWRVIRPSAAPVSPVSAPFPPVSPPFPGETAPPDTVQRVLAGLAAGQSYREVVEAVWECKAGGGAWIPACKAMNAILADLARAAQGEG